MDDSSESSRDRGDSSDSASDSSLLLLEGTRRAMEDFDALLPPREDEGQYDECSSLRSSGEQPRRVRFHPAAAAHAVGAERGEGEESSVPARHVSQAPQMQSQQQVQQQQMQSQQQVQQEQPRTRKFDGRRIRNLSSRIRGRMHQEQQYQQEQQEQQYQNQRNQIRNQDQAQIRNQDGSAGSESGLVPRRASLDGACEAAALSSGRHHDHDCYDDDVRTEAKVRRRASDNNMGIGNMPTTTSSSRDRREYRHAHTLPPEQTAPPPPSSRSLSRDELRALGRKAGAAVAGGSLIALGIPLLPMPGPVGEAMSIGGMAVLAKEFPAAQKVLDVSRDKLVEVLDKTAPPTEEDGEDGEEDDGDDEHDGGKDEDHEGRGLNSKVAAHHHGGNSMHSDDGGGVIGAATNLSRRCASDSVRCNQQQPLRPQHPHPRQAPPPSEGDYFHLHDELLLEPTSSLSSGRHLHRHNYHQGHYGHHGHYNHRRQGSWRNRNKQKKKKKKKKKGPSKLKRSLHRSIHGMGTKVVLPLMDTVCTEREGAASSSANGGGGGVGASTRKAFAGARSRLRSTFQSLSNEVAAGWREVEEEYAQQAQAQAEAAKLAHMRRMQELEQQQQQRMRMAQEQQRLQSLQAVGAGGAGIVNRSVFQQLLDASNGDGIAMQRRGSYASASSSGQYEEDYVEEEDEEWETESCPERWIDVDESLWETMSL